ncbi:MAG: VCBS repeat-containing protein [Caldilineaceae bacterium]
MIKRVTSKRWLVLLSVWGALAACVPIQPTANQIDMQGAIAVTEQALAAPSTPCADSFVPHELDHVTTVEGKVVRLFESNGAGLAINDLDNDGDLDLVLANLAGPNAIFWNEGALHFRKELLSHGDSRAVAIVDVDGDGWQDLIFTRRTTALPTGTMNWERQTALPAPSLPRAFCPVSLSRPMPWPGAISIRIAISTW